MRLNDENFNVRELSVKELQSINGGGKGWDWLGRVVGTVKNVGEAIWDGMSSTQWDIYNI